MILVLPQNLPSHGLSQVEVKQKHFLVRRLRSQSVIDLGFLCIDCFDILSINPSSVVTRLLAALLFSRKL